MLVVLQSMTTCILCNLLISHDCGIFLMKSLEVFVPTKDLRKEFSKEDILHLRIQFANLLFFHAGNKADRSLVTNFYVKVHFVYFCKLSKFIVSPFYNFFFFLSFFVVARIISCANSVGLTCLNVFAQRSLWFHILYLQCYTILLFRLIFLLCA
jgi:hypothetical protein